jgi:2-polyprenyl-3-methyl-5-hydroxy-6-metoxy-1,4-benzoquinol methylase
MERAIQANRLGRLHAEEVFGRIHAGNEWRGKESVSGPGSDVASCGNLISQLPKLFRDFGIRSILDVPCGDWNWMQKVDLRGIDYTGADIVPDLIHANIKNHAKPGHIEDAISFFACNMISDKLPKCDLVLCRDGLVHLSFNDAKSTIAGIKASGSKFLLCTTFVRNDRTNVDMTTGGWRALNMELLPFGFPRPIRLICEGKDGEYQDKYLGLWETSAIKG